MAHSTQCGQKTRSPFKKQKYSFTSLTQIY